MGEERTRTRAMESADVAAAVDVFGRSLAAMRMSVGLPAAYDSSRLDGGVDHLLTTDPDGSRIVEGSQGELLGFVQAARRGELWLLCHLFVDPGAQARGLGAALLAEARAYGADCRAGLIASTPFPAALTLYARLPGFVLHPTISASGVLRRDRLPDVSAVRQADREARGLVDALDERLRGGPRGADLDYLLDQGATLLVLGERGYALASPSQVDLLAATDADAGEQLLAAALAHTRPGAEVTIKRIGSGQPWATRLAANVGLSLRPWGPLVSWNSPAAQAAYLPDSAFC